MISRRLTEAMGGDLGVSQNDRVGTTFTFTAVLGVSTDRRASAPGQSAGSLVGKLALIVDDNLTNRRVLQLLLQDFGMICTKVASPAAALELLATGARFDVAVLDMHMPDMDGQQLAVALRALPAGRDLPLVLLTSLQWRPDSAHRSLFVATLTKPAKSNVLQEKLLSAVAPGEAALLAVETIGGRRSRDAPANTEDSLHVLVAEDNPVNQRVAQLMLAQLGHRVDIVGNGREAVEAVRRTSYDYDVGRYARGLPLPPPAWTPERRTAPVGWCRLAGPPPNPTYAECWATTSGGHRLHRPLPVPIRRHGLGRIGCWWRTVGRVYAANQDTWWIGRRPQSWTSSPTRTTATATATSTKGSSTRWR